MHLSLLNGVNSELSLQHRGLAYGDGLFETLKVEAGQIQFLTQHLARLEKGAAALALNWSAQDSLDLGEQLMTLAEQINEAHVAKVMVLRNSHGRGYDFDPDKQTTDLIVQLQPYTAPSWPQQGVDLVVADSPISENASLAGLKHLNRLDSVLARQCARQQGVHEALMLDQHNCLIEGTMSNLFVKIDGQWRTPPLVNAGVAGIIRALLLAYRVEIREQVVHIDEIPNIEAAFITNSLIGVVAVKKINNHLLSSYAETQAYQQEIQNLC